MGLLVSGQCYVTSEGKLIQMYFMVAELREMFPIHRQIPHARVENMLISIQAGFGHPSEPVTYSFSAWGGKFRFRTISRVLQT